MKHLCILFVFTASCFYAAQAQSTVAKLPWAYYMTMTNNCNSADIVLLKGQGGSVNIDDKNMGFVKELVANASAERIQSSPAATIMCLKDGKEFISGEIFVKGDEGVISFRLDGKEYVNMLSDKGMEFFRSVMDL